MWKFLLSVEDVFSSDNSLFWIVSINQGVILCDFAQSSYSRKKCVLVQSMNY